MLSLKFTANFAQGEINICKIWKEGETMGKNRGMCQWKKI